jgi:hypothetical protein
MSAELLRHAATVLREHAGGAQNKRPWCPDYTWAAVRHVQRNCGDDFECGMHGADPDAECWSFDMYDGRYVALMHPPVALALAALLDAAAPAWAIDGSEPPRNPKDRAVMYELVALARAILREDPDA